MFNDTNTKNIFIEINETFVSMRIPSTDCQGRFKSVINLPEYKCNILHLNILQDNKYIKNFLPYFSLFSS